MVRGYVAYALCATTACSTGVKRRNITRRSGETPDCERVYRTFRRNGAAMRMETEASQEAAMDRQFILAAAVALTLAALTHVAKFEIPAVTAIQPDTMWLVGP